MKNIPALLADFANGLFALLLAAYVSEIEVLWWHIPVGIVLAILPDLDAVPELLHRGKVAASAQYQSDHRDLLHKPLLFMVIGIILTINFGYWGWVFFFATVLHFLNDMYGTGWGVPLFAPFSKHRYKLFTNQDNDFSMRPRHFLRVIKYDSLQNEIVEHGDEDWIKHTYIQVGLLAIIEYSLFFLACVLLFVHFMS